MTRSSETYSTRPLGRWVLHPWLMGVYPVLFLYAHNILYVESGAVLRALPIVLGGVTVVFALLFGATRSPIRAGLLTTAYSVLFFSYGAVHDLVAARTSIGQPVLLVVWALAAAVVTTAVVRGFGSQPLNEGLNLVAGVLVLMPLATVAASAWEDFSQPPLSDELLASPVRRTDARALPDIYFIVLDEYQRRDHLAEVYGFDNGPFESALEARGFYIAPEANSNYTKTLLSLASTLNMRYLDDVLSLRGRRRVWGRLQRMVERPEVGKILRGFGYTHIHISSGKYPTATSEAADVVYDFAPSGVLRFTDSEIRRGTVQHDYREFTMLLLGTTLAGRLIERSAQEQIILDSDVPYIWYAPERMLMSFEVVAAIPAMSEPTFTLFHLISPHAPFMFDRDGNVLEKPPGWTWKDGRDDTRALLEQLEFLNRKVIDLVDALLESSDNPPIIIIQGDHGENVYEQNLVKRTQILSAFLLPASGRGRLYPSISSVNTFRLILSHYFDQPLDQLDYRGWASVESELVEVSP